MVNALELTMGDSMAFRKESAIDTDELHCKGIY
jgi:hypothetical protein